MKVTVKFDVETSPQWYIIDGQDGFDKGVDEFTDKIIDAYEAQKPYVYERNGYVIKERSDLKDWALWEPQDTENIALVAGHTSKEMWSAIEMWARNSYTTKYVRPGAVLAEFLEERGL